MTTESQILEQFYGAINRNDMPALGAWLDPQIVRIEPAGFPASGTYRGLAEVQEHFAQARGTWAEGTCEPEKFLVHGSKVVAHVHVRVRLKDSADWIDARIADGFVFRGGKIIEFRTFPERADALEWAGLADPA